MQTLKAESEKISHFLKMKDLGQPLIKRKKKYVRIDKRIENVLAEFSRNNDLKKMFKCLELSNQI